MALVVLLSRVWADALSNVANMARHTAINVHAFKIITHSVGGNNDVYFRTEVSRRQSAENSTAINILVAFEILFKEDLRVREGVSKSLEVLKSPDTILIDDRDSLFCRV